MMSQTSSPFQDGSGIAALSSQNFKGLRRAFTMTLPSFSFFETPHRHRLAFLSFARQAAEPLRRRGSGRLPGLNRSPPGRHHLENFPRTVAAGGESNRPLPK